MRSQADPKRTSENVEFHVCSGGVLHLAKCLRPSFPRSGLASRGVRVETREEGFSWRLAGVASIRIAGFVFRGKNLIPTTPSVAAFYGEPGRSRNVADLYVIQSGMKLIITRTMVSGFNVAAGAF